MTNDKEDDGESGEPLGQAEALHQALDHLVPDPGAHQVDAEDLPEGPAVDFPDELLKT